MTVRRKRIQEAYRLLLRAFGPQGWWPCETQFEMAIGAILTQNTAWRNAELALDLLRTNRLLSPASIIRIGTRRLEAHVRPAGFPKRKARTVLEFAKAASGMNGGWEGFLGLEAGRMRNELLDIWGIGPETADAIALYAGGHPTFVIDRYTRRFASRHGLAPEEASYEQLRLLFMSSLEPDAAVFGEYHALLVRLGKEFCRAQPECGRCPLRRDLHRLMPSS
jgi:endonuclease-3 related protein